MPVAVSGRQSNGGSNSTSHSATLPAHSAGDLLIVLFGIDGAPTISSVTSGWVQLLTTTGGSSSHIRRVYAKVATSSSETFSFTSSASEASAFLSWTITGHNVPAGSEASRIGITGNSQASGSAALPTRAIDVLRGYLAITGGSSASQALIPSGLGGSWTNFRSQQTTATGTAGTNAYAQEQYFAANSTSSPITPGNDSTTTTRLGFTMTIPEPAVYPANGTVAVLSTVWGDPYRTNKPLFKVARTELSSASGTSHVVSSMPTHVAGDLLLCEIGVDGNPTITMPAGWDAIDQQIGASNSFRREVWAKVATSSSEALTITTNVTEAVAAIVTSFRGHGVSNPLTDIIRSGAAIAGAAGPQDLPTVSGLTAGVEYILVLGANSISAGNFAIPNLRTGSADTVFSTLIPTTPVGDQTAVTGGSGSNGTTSWQNRGRILGVTSRMPGTLELSNGQLTTTIAIPLLTSVTHQAAGVVPIVTTIAGAVTKSPKPVGGAVPVVTTVSGTVTKRLAGAGTVPVVTTVAGTVTSRRPAAGVVPVVATVSGAATKRTSVSGSVLILSTVAGALTNRRQAAGSVSIVSGVSGTVTKPQAAAGVVSIISTAGEILATTAFRRFSYGDTSYTTGTEVTVLLAAYKQPSATELVLLDSPPSSPRLFTGYKSGVPAQWRVVSLLTGAQEQIFIPSDYDTNLHAVVIRHSASVFDVHVDGVLESSMASDGAVPLTGLRLGYDYQGLRQYPEGLIPGLFVWDRLLTDEEILRATDRALLQGFGDPTVIAQASGVVPVVTTIVGAATKAPYAVSGTVAIVSNVAGAATKTPYSVNGTVPIVSDSSGGAVRRSPVSGVVPIVTTIAGAATKRTFAVGVVEILSGAAGTLSSRRPASGAVAIESAASGEVFITFDADGTVPIQSQIYGEVTNPAIAMAGVVPITSDAQGNVARRSLAAGSVAVSSASEGTVTLSTGVSGGVAVASTVAGSITLAAGASGTVPIVSDVQGDVDVSLRGVVAISSGQDGTATAVLEVAGTVEIHSTATGITGVGLVGIVHVISTTSGSPTKLTSASGDAPVISDTVGDPIKLTSVEGAVPIASDVAGEISSRRPVDGTVPIVSSGAGAVTAIAVTSGTVVVLSAASGNPVISGASDAAGTVQIFSTAAGALSKRSQAAAVVSVVSDAYGAVTRVATVAGVITVQSAVTGAATARRVVSGSVSVTSTLVGAVTRLTPAAGDIEIVSSAAGDASLLMQVAGIVEIISMVAGNVIVRKSGGYGYLTLTPRGPHLGLRGRAEAPSLTPTTVRLGLTGSYRGTLSPEGP